VCVFTLMFGLSRPRRRKLDSFFLASSMVSSSGRSTQYRTLSSLFGSKRSGCARLFLGKMQLQYSQGADYGRGLVPAKDLRVLRFFLASLGLLLVFLRFQILMFLKDSLTTVPLKSGIYLLRVMLLTPMFW